jgi:hypothetical protein
VQLPYPLHSGEPQILREKQKQEIAPGIDLDSITDAELVIPKRHFKIKRVIELQYEFIGPQSKGKVGSVGKMRMTAREEGL